MLEKFLRNVAEGADIAANWFSRLDPQEQYLALIALAIGVMKLYNIGSSFMSRRSYRRGVEDGKLLHKQESLAAFEDWQRRHVDSESNGEAGE